MSAGLFFESAVEAADGIDDELQRLLSLQGQRRIENILACSAKVDGFRGRFILFFYFCGELMDEGDGDVARVDASDRRESRSTNLASRCRLTATLEPASARPHFSSAELSADSNCIMARN